MIFAFWLAAVSVGFSLINAGWEYRKQRKKEEELEKERRENFAEPDFPKVSEGDVIPVVFGTADLTSPNIVFFDPDAPWGTHHSSDRFFTDKEDSRVMRSGGGFQIGGSEIVGRGDQRARIHIVWCQSPVDEIVEMRSGNTPLGYIDTPWGRTSDPDTGITDNDTLVTSWNFIEQHAATGEAIFPLRYDGPNEVTGPHTEKPNLTAPDYRSGYYDVAGFSFLGDAPENPSSVIMGGWPNDDITPSDDIWQSAGAVRGVLSMFARIVWPYGRNLDDQSMTVKRRRRGSFGAQLDGADLYSDPENTTSDADMNGVAIIEEILRDEQWGMGEDPANISESHFIYASMDAPDSDIGLSFVWAGRQSYQELIGEILRHIDGAVYIEPTTGQWAIRLVRDDYDLDSMVQQAGDFSTKPIHTITPDDIEGDPTYSQPAVDDLVNEVTILYPDREAGRDRSFTDHDVAAQLFRRPVSQEIRYPFIRDREMAVRLAARDLVELSQPLKNFSLTVPSGLFPDLRPADVFVLSYPDWGIEQMVCRIVAIDGEASDEKNVSIEAVQDVFSLRDAVVAPPDDIDPPVFREHPEPADLYESEVFYWLECQRVLDFDYPNAPLATREQVRIDVSEYDRGAVMAAASTDQAAAIRWDMWVDPPGVGGGETGIDFSPSARIIFNSQLNDETITGANFEVGGDFSPQSDETLAIVEIDGILSGVRDWDLDLQTADVELGLFETVPPFPTSSVDGQYPILAYGKYDDDTGELVLRRIAGVDPQRRTDSTDVDVKALPRTLVSTLDPDDIGGETVTISRRMYRPYPPGRVRIDSSQDNPGGIDVGHLTFGWSTRARQSNQLFQHQTSLIDVEQDGIDGLTLDIYCAPNTDLTNLTLLRSESLPVASVSYQYDGADELIDREEAGFGRTESEVIHIRLTYSRDGFDSEENHRTYIRHPE